MKRYDKWFFELEFQVGQNGKYVGEVIVGSRISGEDWGVVPIGECDSLKELENEFQSFKNDFLLIYKTVATEQLREKGLGQYGSL
ncbi:hypothetical protein [Bacillus paralicheniformis]|uniref:hypothetical protein n=1 Tax=Bacillus paralicheniformis TaxID=1648923 RepID=UPI00189D9AA0|nr:hypothetical protein [Bacillus paralicheniformis]